MAIAGKIDREQVLRDVAAAIEIAKEGGKVAIVGFCLGGTVAWSAAGRLPGLSAAVGYYGGGIIGLKDLKPARPDAAAFRREGPAHSRSWRERGRRRPSGRRGPHLSRRSRLQLRPAGELRRAERRARLDAHDCVPAQASGVSGAYAVVPCPRERERAQGRGSCHPRTSGDPGKPYPALNGSARRIDRSIRD